MLVALAAYLGFLLAGPWGIVFGALAIYFILIVAVLV